MLKSLVYMKNYRRLMMAFTVFLLYLSMYLLHNAVGTLCIIKTADDSKGNEGDIEASRLLLYRVNNSNLFVSNAKFCSLLSPLAAAAAVCSFAFAMIAAHGRGSCTRSPLLPREHDYFE
jgi:hypothetical protein